ncbi:aldose epimerase family protein [Gilvimarinus polysaccharolyticus]|uniref:aldose epimerase family protein n=1 Tax=Gilvimarinus polysaccharolyticus TaxID=863921 RepID=UPI0006735AE1|nr:aldose epimerase family protein [Gilvimarinus polysaccharolyticus]
MSLLSARRITLFSLLTMLILPVFADVVVSEFGALDNNRTSHLYRLTNAQGSSAELTNLGALLVSLKVPDRNGDYADVVLGFDTAQQYLTDSPFFGATIGRYANRIASGRFSLNGQTYQLANNNPPNHLHGGAVGFDKRLWRGEVLDNSDEPAARFTLLSEDGDEGYPGNLQVAVTYRLTADNALQIDYQANSDAATVINLTHHSYFNLSGHTSGDVLAQQLQVNADFYTPVDGNGIPTGEILSVDNTPFDFTQKKALGRDIKADNAMLKAALGFDQNWVLRAGKFADDLVLAATLTDPVSGRQLQVLTTEPGLQVYTGNHLSANALGKDGFAYSKHAGVALEPQHFPDSPNQPHFPRTTLKAGETFSSRTVYQFSLMQ